MTREQFLLELKKITDNNVLIDFCVTAAIDYVKNSSSYKNYPSLDQELIIALDSFVSTLPRYISMYPIRSAILAGAFEIALIDFGLKLMNEKSNGSLKC